MEALEAAHIIPYNSDATNETYNGLLLRADIHTLFDLGLIRINPESRSIILDPSLASSSHGELDGCVLSSTLNPDDAPSKTALTKRWETFGVLQCEVNNLGHGQPDDVGFHEPSELMLLLRLFDPVPRAVS